LPSLLGLVPRGEGPAPSADACAIGRARGVPVGMAGQAAGSSCRESSGVCAEKEGSQIGGATDQIGRRPRVVDLGERQLARALHRLHRLVLPPRSPRARGGGRVVPPAMSEPATSSDGGGMGGGEAVNSVCSPGSEPPLGKFPSWSFRHPVMDGAGERWRKGGGTGGLLRLLKCVADH
jgi:hypothetical protein